MILRVIALLLTPLLAFAIGARVMALVTKRDAVMARWNSDPDSSQRRPLNQRFGGYTAADVEHMWNALDQDMRHQERRFLYLDLAFPLVYGGAFLLALVGFGRLTSLPLSVGALIGLVVVLMSADWVENFLQLHQLARFEQHLPLQRGVVAIASVATVLKLVIFSVVTLLTLASAFLVISRRGS